MTNARAIAGDYADLKLVKTRSVIQVVIEMPIEEGENIVKMFGIPLPSSPVKLAVARLATTPTIESEVVPDDRTTKLPVANRAGGKAWTDLPPAQQAGIRCGEKAFWKFLAEYDDGGPVVASAEDAANYVRLICGVKSRAELTTSSRARLLWKDLEQQYQAWLAAPAYAPVEG